MFKIGSRVEITHEDQEVIQKTGYDPIAGKYVCPNCKKSKYPSDFYDWAEPIEVVRDLIFSREDIEEERFYAIEGISFIRKFENECSNCGFPNDADLIFFVQGGGDEWVIESDICFSDTLDFEFSSFLSLGLDIYSILPSLFLRWWRMGWEIDIVVPFVNSEYFYLFHNFGKYFLAYNRNLSDNNVELNVSPFRYIIFRKYQSRFKGKVVTVDDTIQDFYNRIHKKNGEDYFYLNQNGVAAACDSIYQVVNEVKDYPHENLAHKYSGNFHAKFIAGVGDANTELYLMSYNFGEVEDLQFETQYIVELDSQEYNREINVFLKYHRLQIEKYKNS